MTIRRSHAMAATVVAGAFLVGSSAFAATALNSADPLQACVSNANGQMRLTAYGSECKTNESPVTWNVQGPAGPQGEQGPAGDKGEPGTGGEDYMSGYEIVRNSGTVKNAGGQYGDVIGHSVSATCPDGKVPLGVFYNGTVVTQGRYIDAIALETYIAGSSEFKNYAAGAVLGRIDGRTFLPSDTLHWTVTATCAKGPTIPIDYP